MGNSVDRDRASLSDVATDTVSKCHDRLPERKGLLASASNVPEGMYDVARVGWRRMMRDKIRRV